MCVCACACACACILLPFASRVYDKITNFRWHHIATRNLADNSESVSSSSRLRQRHFYFCSHANARLCANPNMMSLFPSHSDACVSVHINNQARAHMDGMTLLAPTVVVATLQVLTTHAQSSETRWRAWWRDVQKRRYQDDVCVDVGIACTNMLPNTI